MTSKKKKEELPQDLESLIAILDEAWPKKKTEDITRVFDAIRKKIEKTPPPAPVKTHEKAKPTDILDSLRRTLSAQDVLFLRRQITYHMAASAGLQSVYVDPDRVQMAIAKLLEYMATRAPRGSRISVQLGEIQMRTGTGIEIAFTGMDNSLKDIDKSVFLQRMYKAEENDGLILVTCREIIASQGGQMWADLPRPRQAVFRMVLPTSEAARDIDKTPKQLFKYDISIANYANLRKRFGIKKSLVLVGQIELYVRALVRHPIDIVTAVREKGIITTIYETPKGAAQSVAGRISQRLGSEEFRIGKKIVSLSFRYKLSQLAANSGQT